MVDLSRLAHLFNPPIHNQQAALTDEAKAAFLKLQENLVQQFKTGDHLQGMLIQKEGQLYLQLQEGTQLSVKLEEHAPLGEWLKLEVIQVSEGKLVLGQPLELPDVETRARTMLNLPDTAEMKACIQAFVQEELPLDREQLLRTYQLVKQTELPLPTITALLKASGGDIEVFMKSMMQYVSEDVPSLVERFKGLVFSQHPECSPSELKGTYEALAKALLECPGTKPSELAAKAYNDVVCLTKATVEHRQPAFRVAPSLVELAKLPEMAWRTLEASPLVFKEWTRKLFEGRFNTPLMSSGTAEKMTVKDDMFFNSAIRLEKCLRAVCETSLPKGQKESLEALYEPLQVQIKLQEQGHYYYYYPLTHDQTRQDATVYFYKQKNKQAKNKKDYFAVIALDLPALHEIEVHVHKMDNTVAIDFYTAHEKVRQFLSGEMTKLQQQLADTELAVVHVTCHLKHLDEGLPKLYERFPVTGFDQKA